MPELVAPVMRVLETADVRRSVGFYRDMLGFHEQPVGDDGHAGAAAELALGAARVQLVPADEPCRSVAFFQAADVAALRESVRVRGAEPSELVRVNWIKYEMFEVRDPDGHALWFGQSYNREMERPRGLVEKALPAFPCDDVAAAVAHYRDVLGFGVNYQQADLGVMYRDDVTVLLVPRGASQSGRPESEGHAFAEFYVRDADALFADLRARGANVLGTPVSHPWGLRDFSVLDGDGNRLAFAQPFE